jgi:hypothetical protein
MPLNKGPIIRAPTFFNDGTNHVMRLDQDLVPGTTDGAALGTSTLNWADLFLDSGSVINFDSGNVTLTHSAGVLTFTGALTVGVNDAGHDVKFFGNTASKYMLWDTSEDDLIVIGDVGIGAGTGIGTLTVTNTGSSTPEALLLQNLTAVGTADTGVNIVWQGNTGGQSMASQIVAWEGTDTTATYMSFFTRTSNSTPSEKMRLKSNGQVDLMSISTGGLINVGASGNDWTANDIALSSARAGGANQILIYNTDTTASSSAILRLETDATDNAGVDPYIDFHITGVVGWQMGCDNSEGDRLAISTSAVGSADCIRITTAKAVSFDDQNSSYTTFSIDYVCDGCGKAAIDMFECCGVVAWHDDVLALRELQLSPEGLKHMAKLGIYEIDGPDDSEPGAVFINYQKATKYTWAGMYQNRQRMDAQYDELHKRLEAIGA